jgi:hypothetical protein
MAMTQQDIEKWAVSVHLTFSDKNAALLTGWLTANQLAFTVENLSRAVADSHFRFGLEFERGYEPKEPVAAPAARPKRDRFNELLDVGVAPVRHETDSHAYREAHSGDDAKEAEARRAQAVAQQKAAEQKRLQHAEESVTVFHDHGPTAGRINHAATERARLEAKQKWAKITGVQPKPSDGGIGAIPLEGVTDQELKTYSADQIRHWCTRRRQAGLK